MHFLRIRDLIGVTGDRTDLSQGIQAGLSLHDDITRVHASTPSTNGADTNPMTAYDFDSPASLNVLLQPTQDPTPRPIKSISLSPWNPPPYHLRTKGHLLYLQVTTNEGEQFQITSHATGFFVNRSSNSKFDPFPKSNPKVQKAHSLLTLVSRLSPSFDGTFKSLQEYSEGRNQLALFQPSNAIPTSPWIVSPATSNLASHASDLARTQEAYLITGADNAETLRDWNEEFQTLKELPKETVQDRVFRERATSKLFADYTEAATAGAVLIARGEVQPLNPTENRDAQIFVYNNVFYSFGADGVGTFTNEGGDEAARVATGRDVSGVRMVNQLDIQGLSSPGTVVIDYLGKRLVCQSIVPGIFRQREPGDNQIDYGGTEGKETVAENEAFHPLFEKLAKAMRTKRHTVWDKEGKKHELETSVETKGLIGTDARKYALDLYRLTPLDISWIDRHWTGLPAEGEAETHEGYVHRMTVLRPELVDSFWRLKLREYIGKALAKRDESKANGAVNGDHKPVTANGEPEVQPSVNGETAIERKDGEKSEEEAKAEPVREQVDVSGFDYALNPDVFSGQEPQTEEEKEAWAQDELEVRAACDYLHNETIPRLISDLQEGEVGFPMDGQSLCSLLHKRGINVRYLGKIAELSAKDEPRLRALEHLTKQEMIARGFKHVANTYMRGIPSVFTSVAMTHLLNCLLGSKLNKAPTVQIDEELRSLYTDVDFAFEKLTAESLQAEVTRQIQLRYRYSLDAGWIEDVKHLQLLREISLKLGLQLGAKEFTFSKSASETKTNGTSSHSNELLAPVANGNVNGKKKKRGGDRSPARSTESPPPMPEQTFNPDDIYNIVPVIKESAPRSVLADEALEAGRLSIAQNQRELGQELLLESLSLHEQIYGVLHPEVARAYHTLSTLFYGLDDKPIAVELARKAVIVSERTLGIDSNETLLGYLNLGLFEHANANSRLALTYFRHALQLSKIVYGPNHPDAVTTLNNAAVMLQSLKLFHDSRAWFEASLSVCQTFSGPNSVHTGTILFQLAQALALDHDPKAAVNRMREAYTIFLTHLGANDRNTKEAESWLTQLTQNAVNIAKHAKEVEGRRMRRLGHGQMTPGGRLMQQRQVGQSNADAAGMAGALGALSSTMGAATSAQPRPLQQQLDERSIDELLRYIEGGDAAKSSPRRKTTNPKRRPQKV